MTLRPRLILALLILVSGAALWLVIPRSTVKSEGRGAGLSATEIVPMEDLVPAAPLQMPQDESVGQDFSAQDSVEVAEREIAEDATATPEVVVAMPPPSPTPTPGAQAMIFGQPDQWIRPDVGDVALVARVAERTGWCDVYSKPKRSAARILQALVGDKVRVIDEYPGWFLLRAMDKTWEGWARTTDVTLGTKRVRRGWARLPAWRVIAAPGIPVPQQAFLPFAAVLPVVKKGEHSIECLLPDGRAVVVARSEMSPLKETPDFLGLLDRVKGFRRIRFQIGGNTLEAMDGAGLVWLLYRAAGKPLPRDSVQQRSKGRAVDSNDLRPADVVYFAGYHEGQRRAVIMVDNGNTFLESAASSGVAFGTVEQLRHREVLEARRFIQLRGVEPGDSGAAFVWR